VSGPRYVTLRDYLRVLRENRWLILLIAVVFTAAAYLVTSSQDKKYKAETAVSIRDATEDLDFLDPAPVRQTPAELTSVALEDVESPEMARGVRKELKLNNSSLKSIDNAISAKPEALTNFINIQAKARSPELAARLANAAARQMKASRARETKDRLARLARSLRREYRESVDRRTDIFQRAAFEERVARIDAVREIADPVEIVRTAEVPESADSPKIVRNTLLGLLIGLTLGIVAAFVRDSLDVKLRGSEQMSEQLGVPVLGQISDSALGKGVTEANGTKALSGADADAFHIVRANLSFLDSERPPRSVAVTSALAEEGKSTVAAALAWSYATSGQRALLLECDLRRPSLAGRLGLKTEPGLSDYLAGKASTQEAIQSPELLRDGPTANGASGNGQGEGRTGGLPTPHLDVIVAGAPVAGPAQLLGSPTFRDFLAVITRSYDITILDCTPLLSVVDTLELLAHVDAVLLCVRAGRTTRDQARAARGALDRFPPKPTGVVVTGARRLGKTDYGYYYASQAGEPA
jgi:polysaccharide biosynthesis transport protein